MATLCITFENEDQLAQFVEKLRRDALVSEGATWGRRNFAEAFGGGTAYQLRDTKHG